MTPRRPPPAAMPRRQPAAAAAAAALAALLALVALAPRAAAAVSEFTPSVVMTNFGEMGQPCIQMVDNALKLKANSVKFVPTVHYWGNAERIDKFCYRWEAARREAARKLRGGSSSLFGACRTQLRPLGN